MDAPIVSGSIEKIETFTIKASFNGIIGNREVGRSEAYGGSISGEISEDIATLKGTLWDNNGRGGEFAATR